MQMYAGRVVSHEIETFQNETFLAQNNHNLQYPYM